MTTMTIMTQVADLKTARWGRPSVGTIGGKITGEDDADELHMSYHDVCVGWVRVAHM